MTDRGLGDTIGRVADVIANFVNLEACGCEKRKEWLNRLFPYDTTVRRFEVRRDFVHDHKIYRVGMQLTVTKKDSIYKGVITLVSENTLFEL